MGTLFNQRHRHETLQDYVGLIFTTADKMYPNLSIRNMSPAQWEAAAKVTSVGLDIQSADAFDEQLAGFGEIAQSIAENVRTDHPLNTGDCFESIASAIRELATRHA